MAELVSGFENNLGLADAAEALDGSALAVIGVRTRGDPREKLGKWLFAAYEILISTKRDDPVVLPGCVTLLAERGSGGGMGNPARMDGQLTCDAGRTLAAMPISY